MTTCGSTPVIPAIHHTVAFRLRHPSGSPDETAFVDAARALATIPGMEDFRQFRQVSPKSDFTFFFLMRFADADAYSSYNEHPVHVAFVGTAGTARSATSKSPTLLPSTAITFELSRFAPGGLEHSQVLRPSRPKQSRDSVSLRDWSSPTFSSDQPNSVSSITRGSAAAAGRGAGSSARHRRLRTQDRGQSAIAARLGRAAFQCHSRRPLFRLWRR
jgi:Stress responsive A/B Barrel Domain